MKKFFAGLGVFLFSFFNSIFFVAPLFVVIYNITMYDITQFRINELFVLGVLSITSLIKLSFKKGQETPSAKELFIFIVSYDLLILATLGIIWGYKLFL